MCDTWKNRSHIRKNGSQFVKNVSHLVKWVTFEKRITIGKMRHKWLNVSNLVK